MSLTTLSFQCLFKSVFQLAFVSGYKCSHFPLNELLPRLCSNCAIFIFLQSNKVLSTQLVAIETEKAELLLSLSAVEAELAVQGEELQRVQSHLVTERESRVKTAEALQNQLNEKVPKSSTIEQVNIFNIHF